MYIATRRKFPMFSWLIPILLVLSIGTIAIYDYTRQHVKVTVFGTTVDAANVRSVLIQPVQSTGKQQFQTISGHGQIVELLEQLSQAKSVSADMLLPGDTALVSLYLDMSKSNIMQIRLYQSSASADAIWVAYQNKIFQSDEHLKSLIQQLQKDKG